MPVKGPFAVDLWRFDDHAYLIAGLLVVAIESALIAGLLVQRRNRRRAEERQRTSDERYRSVVETQSDLICRFRPDSTLTFVNDAYCRFWNKSRSELLGMRFVNLIPAGERAGVLARLGQLQRGHLSHEHPVTLSDGTVGWQHWINQAILDNRGRLAEIQGVGRDVSERKRAEEHARALEARNGAILRAIPDLMLVLSRNGTCIDYHGRQPTPFVCQSNDLVGRKIRDILPAPAAELFMVSLERVFQTREPVVLEYELMRAESHRFEARLVAAEADRVLTIVRDITEAKRALDLNRELAGRLIVSQESERQRIARELHDDLSQRIALLTIELDQTASKVPASEHAQRLRRLSARASEIATAVHQLSHELHPHKLKSLGLSASLRALCREVSNNRPLRVHFSHDELPRTIDPNVSLCLYRIAQEALHNVAKHSRAVEARVRLIRERDDLCLYVDDSGIGFDPRIPRDDGLGLVSMRERVGPVHGQVAIHSAPGVGTSVQVRVPLKPAVSFRVLAS